MLNSRSHDTLSSIDPPDGARRIMVKFKATGERFGVAAKFNGSVAESDEATS